MIPAIIPKRVALVGLLIVSPLLAGVREDIGFPELQAEFGGSLPDGSTLKIAQIDYLHDGAWAPEAVDELASKAIVYSPSNPASFSETSGEAGRMFFGTLSSIIAAASEIHAFEAWDYFDNSLKTAKGVAPLAAGWDIESHGYISDSGLANDEGLRRLDYRIDHDDVTATVVLENGTGSVPPLFANAYNAIVVGSSTGNHSRGGSAGRLKPDIVGTATYTSYAGPIVGSAAGLLIAKAKAGPDLASAKRPEVIKAILMAGATKDEFPTWSRTATAPLDPIYGAGEVNINNSYRILVAGRQPASASTLRSSRGWDLNPAGVDACMRYYFTIGAGQSGTISAVLTWNREVIPNDGSWSQGTSVSVANYDLRLYRATAGFEKGELLQDSVSAIDNVEHIFLKDVSEGTYLLEVSSVAGSKQFGIAWMVSGVDAGISTQLPDAPKEVFPVSQSSAQAATDPSSLAGSDTAPSITSQPVDATVNVGGNALFSVSATGTAPFSYQWRKNDAAISDATSASLAVTSAQFSDAATYEVVVSNNAGQTTSRAAVLTVKPVSSDNTGGKLVNISSRSKVGTGSDILISGFVLTGTAPKLLLIRAVGPSLAQFGLTGLLQRPKIKVFSGNSLIFEAASGSRIPSTEVVRSASELGGAFALPDSSRDTAIVHTFAPGAYTVQVSDENGVPGIAIAEVYDLDPSNSACRLVNLSTRSVVGRDSEILIPGIFVGGKSARRFLVRAVGPGLKQWGVPNTVAQPKIALYKGATKIAENVGWNSNRYADEIAALSSHVGAYPIRPDSADSALLVTLDPGAYTLHVSGADGGTGVALAEVYDSGPVSTADGSTDSTAAPEGSEVPDPDHPIEARAEESRPRKIFGHYMGCFAAGSGAIQYHATSGIESMDPPGAVLAEQKNLLRPLLADWAIGNVGGTYRNFAFAPQNKVLSTHEAAELEIRRAMRIGLDGFTFDAWAGGKGARDLLDVMFEICEAKNLPFELTITLDTSCLNSTDPDLAVYPGNVWEKTIKWLLDKHGNSPKLARRDGKVLIMGYQSVWPGQYAISQHVKNAMPDATATERTAEVNRLRTSEEGWQMIADAYRQMEANVGQPIYWEFCLSGFFVGVPNVSSGTIVKAAAFLAKQFPAMGMFLWEGPVPDIATAVLSAGAEWSHPMKLQYENFSWMQTASPGINWVRGDWNYARTLPSTLIQHITWNDYHECTNLSPGYNTRYAYYDITGEFIRWWKTGRQPASNHDKVYIFSHKYAAGTRMFPFQAKSRADNLIEVVTILPEPATLRMPGRVTVDGESEWQAPAGMSSKQFPLTPGPVSVELVRNGVVAVRLGSPEPVSDRPFRQDTGKVGVSTEDHRLWAEDFGENEPFLSYSEYGDADGDGLPNWFEMLWYGKFGLMKTATGADPDADPAGTGKTNLQHYVDQTSPFGN